MTEPSLEAAFRAFAAERRYSDAMVDRWLRLDAADRDAVFDLAGALHLGENQLRDLWEWAQDIAARDRLSLARVLTLEPIAAARQRPVSRNDKLKLVKSALRRLRLPQLAAVEARLAVLVRELALPANVRVTLPEFLEGDTLRIEIIADSVASLQDTSATLLAAAQTPACAALFELLAEAP